MPEEVGVILDNLKFIETSRYGDLELFSGEWINNKERKVLITTTWSGWGKVSAARATTRLISKKFQNLPVDILLFTGVAGAVDKKLKQWDIVISEFLIQHDMDARPIFDKYVIPALKKKNITADKTILNNLYNNINAELQKGNLQIFGKIYKGLIATGDIFVSDRKKIDLLLSEISGLLAVEMEGAAFAQVAQQEKIDWIVMRVISDGANEESSEDFNNFLKKYKFKSFELIRCFLNSLM